MKFSLNILLWMAFLATGFAQKNAQKPNIIYILADDLGYGDVSLLNKNSKIKTTHIDALGQQGMKFTDAHSNSAVCSPTRYGILTGRYAWRSTLKSGVLWSYDKHLIEPERPTVASVLKANGYETACIGKWHLGMDWDMDEKGTVNFLKPIKNGPNANGFDYFFGITASLDIPPYFYIENDKITATSIDTIAATTGKGFWRKGPVGNDFKHEEVLPVLAQKAIDYIAAHANKKSPYFLYLPLTAPHTPILPVKAYLGKSGTNAYGDFVLMMDDLVGRIVEAVKASGTEGNTLIVFTSDNGASPAADFKELQSLGHDPSAHFRGAKADVFDGGHRIPFIVKWPGKIEPNTDCHQTICLTDWMATCYAMIDQKKPDHVGEDSYSLMPLFLNKGRYLRKSTIHHSIDGEFAIRKGKWKLIACPGSGGWSFPTKGKDTANLPAVQLYDLEKDPGETKNLQGQYPRVVKKLQKELERTKHSR
jgi:arylsulfatase A-like enzyme